MSDPTRRHATPRHCDERGVVAPSRLMLVVIVVVAIGAAMFFATSPGAKDDAKPAASEQPSARTSGAAPTAPTSSAPAAPSPSASAKPAPSKAPTPTPKPSVKPTAAAPAPAAPVTVDRARTKVAVFNNSVRKGLAKRTATKVTAAGWKVTGTANWRGKIPTTTVYYPKGLKAAAAALAADLGIARVKAAQTPMRNDRLTLILT